MARPVVEVSGRTYPVEVRYRPVVDPDDPDADPDRDQVTAILDAVDELVAEGPGDILVFLAGEREIRDTQTRWPSAALRGTEIVPLYSRLSAADQHKVFAPHTGRRIVLATNVAETSLTVPGIRYVIDPGTARISRYSHRTKVQRLPIEPVSQASARQRVGPLRPARPTASRSGSTPRPTSRAGRSSPTRRSCAPTSPRCCCRWPRSTSGDVADFPFVDPPDRRAVADGVALLEELHALDEHGKLTHDRPGARRAAAGPADGPHGGRGRPARRARRGAGHRRRADHPGPPRAARPSTSRPPTSCTPGSPTRTPTSSRLLNLWRYLGEQQDALSGNQFRRTVKREFLHYLRIREWQDLHGQLRGTARRLGMTVGEPAAEPDERGITPRCSPGCSRTSACRPSRRRATGKRPSREYLGTRNTRFVIAPGHAAGEEAAALGGRRRAGRDQPAVRPHRRPDRPRDGREAGRRTWSSGSTPSRGGTPSAAPSSPPSGSRSTGCRSSSAGGCSTARSTRSSPASCSSGTRSSQGEWTTHHRFWADNQRARSSRSPRSRSGPAAATSGSTTRRCSSSTTRASRPTSSRPGTSTAGGRTPAASSPDLLTFTPEMLTNAATAGQVRAEDYPDEVHLSQGLTLPLSYAFAPGTAEDGVTVDVPLAVLDGVAVGDLGGVAGLHRPRASARSW